MEMHEISKIYFNFFLFPLLGSFSRKTGSQIVIIDV